MLQIIVLILQNNFYCKFIILNVIFVYFYKLRDECKLLSEEHSFSFT